MKDTNLKLGQKPRAREFGLPFPGTPGPLNAITDVPGVAVGFCTLTDPARNMRTGVTAILPRPGNDAAAGLGRAVFAERQWRDDGHALDQ